MDNNNFNNGIDNNSLGIFNNTQPNTNAFDNSYTQPTQDMNAFDNSYAQPAQDMNAFDNSYAQPTQDMNAFDNNYAQPTQDMNTFDNSYAQPTQDMNAFDNNYAQPAQDMNAFNNNYAQPAQDMNAFDNSYAQPTQDMNAFNNSYTQPTQDMNAFDNSYAQPAQDMNAFDNNYAQPAQDMNAFNNNYAQPTQDMNTFDNSYAQPTQDMNGYDTGYGEQPQNTFFQTTGPSNSYLDSDEEDPGDKYVPKIVKPELHALNDKPIEVKTNQLEGSKAAKGYIFIVIIVVALIGIYFLEFANNDETKGMDKATLYVYTSGTSLTYGDYKVSVLSLSDEACLKWNTCKNLSLELEMGTKDNTKSYTIKADGKKVKLDDGKYVSAKIDNDKVELTIYGVKN